MSPSRKARHVLALGLLMAAAALIAVGAEQPKVSNRKCVQSANPNVCNNAGNSACKYLVEHPPYECEGDCHWCDSTNAIPNVFCADWEGAECTVSGETFLCETTKTYWNAQCETNELSCTCTKNLVADGQCGKRVTMYSCIIP